MNSIKTIFNTIIAQSLIEHLVFLVLAFGAIFFHEERLLADSSYYLFRLVNENRFIVEHNRHILVFSQILPFIALKLHLSLKTILIFYSLNHIAFFYIIFLIGRYQYKALEAGWLTIFTQILGIMSGFFVPMFELYYSSGFLIAFYYILNYSKSKYQLIPLLFLEYFIICGHFYAILLFVFVIILHFLKYKFTYWKYYLLFGILIVVYMIIKREIATPYEISKSQAFINNLYNAKYDLNYIHQLVLFLMEYYLEMIILLALTIIFLIKRKKILISITIILFFSLLLIMSNISNYGFHQSRYQEQVYFPISFVVAFGFVKYVFQGSRNLRKILVVLVLVIVSTTRFFVIFEDGIKFKDRVKEMKEYIELAQTKDACKFIVDEDQLVHHANWSWPIETLLFSSADDKKSVSIAITKDLEYSDNKEKLDSTNYMFRRWEIIDLDELNARYFNLCESEYQFLKLNN